MDSRWWHRLGQLSNWWRDKVLGWKGLSALLGGFGSSQESLTQHEAVKYRNWKASWDCVVLSIVIVCRSFGDIFGGNKYVQLGEGGKWWLYEEGTVE